MLPLHDFGRGKTSETFNPAAYEKLLKVLSSDPCLEPEFLPAYDCMLKRLGEYYRCRDHDLLPEK